ncbi:MAG: hypothetical protein ACRDFX_06455, partial [Chloroflexota bacterium]
MLRVLLVLFVAVMMLTSGASAATLLFYGQNLPTLKDFKKKFEFQNTRILDASGQKLYDLADLSKSHGRRIVEPLQMPGQTTSQYRSSNQPWLVGMNDRRHPG